MNYFFGFLFGPNRFLIDKVFGNVTIEARGEKYKKYIYELYPQFDSYLLIHPFLSTILSDDELKKKVKELKIDIGKFSRGKAVEALFEELVEEKLIQPTFIIDYPKESTPLTKVHRKNPELVERFEFFINGAEVGNAYSELNDPIVQRKLLEEQAKELSEGEEEAHPMDEEFVRSMEIGMPPAGGIGIGVDRLVMLMTGAHSLRDVILFPTMKPEKD